MNNMDFISPMVMHAWRETLWYIQQCFQYKHIYGTCDYRMISNVDALQLFERERVLARDIFKLIPTTGNLTPQFISVFWKSKS